MRNTIRFISILVTGILLFALGAFGWTGLLDYLALLFPSLQDFAAAKLVRSLAACVGLALVVLPYYTLLYFHSTTKAQIFGFKTPGAYLKSNPSSSVNPTLSGASVVEQHQEPGNGGC